MAGVEIVAHRGANNVAPENTLAAARFCVERGAEWLEVDVRTSRDGVLYNMHDRNLERTTGGAEKRALSGLTSHEIDSLDAGGWFSAQFSGERIPRIETILSELAGRIKFYFDVKDARLEKLIDLVHRFGIEDESFFWFWNPLLAYRFHRLAPRLRLKINAATPAGVRRARRRYRADIIECSAGALTERMVSTCHEGGMRLMVLFSEDDPQGFRRAIEVGVDMVNVDHVDAFRRVRETFG